MQNIDLTWGECVAVREAFLSQMGNYPIGFTKNNLMKLNYPPFEGNPLLIEKTQEVILRQTGIKYDHIIMTNGAAGAITITLRAYAQQGRTSAITNPPPYFSLYPSMISSAGLKHEIMNTGYLYNEWDGFVILLDSPSNPSGKIHSTKTFELQLKYPIIWDAVYANRVYSSGSTIVPAHDVVTGSYSKLTGLNGIRIGWIGTNDTLLYSRLQQLVAAEYCGLSEASTQLLLAILDQNYKSDKAWETFETLAKMKLDSNRANWSKLERYFSGFPVSDIGMFYYAPMDKNAQHLFEKAGIKWSKGSSLGHNDDHARFNIGHSPEIISKAVAQVLKLDNLK